MNLLYKPHEYNQQRQREKKRWIWPVHLAMEAEHYRELGHEVDWGDDRITMTNGLGETWETPLYDKVITEPEGILFNRLPAPDRKFTNAFDPKYQANGNFKHNPGTYIQSAGGCWWGNCAFCKEQCNDYELRDVDDVIAEIKECKRLGFREVFDDAASFAVGKWRDSFVRKLKPLGMKFSCNMRFGTFPDYYAMKKAGFRMLLYGLESRNKKTIRNINKRIDIKKAIIELKLAARYGLEPHIAVMFGFPWESDKDARRTLRMVHYLLRNGYAKTAQASLYSVPGTPPKMEHAKYIPKIYNVAYSPQFWMNKLKDIKTKDDIKYIWKGIKAWLRR